jgi:hypothetical protein
MIENRVKNFGLITRVRQCTSALASVWFAHSIEAL